VKIIGLEGQQVEKPDSLQLETDLNNGVPYLTGRCNACREHFILKFKGAGKYKCPTCKKDIWIRRLR